MIRAKFPPATSAASSGDKWPSRTSEDASRSAMPSGQGKSEPKRILSTPPTTWLIHVEHRIVQVTAPHTRKHQKRTVRQTSSLPPVQAEWPSAHAKHREATRDMTGAAQPAGCQSTHLAGSTTENVRTSTADTVWLLAKHVEPECSRQDEPIRSPSRTPRPLRVALSCHQLPC